MKAVSILFPLLHLSTTFASPAGEQTVLQLGDLPAYQPVNEWLSDAKKAILKGKNNLEKWYHDGKEFIKQNGLLYEVVSHPSFDEHQLRVTDPELCDTSVKQYSGYLDIANDKHLFFWFFESRNAPSTDPLVLWLNGGPGCSSSTGLLFELGPCSIANEGKNTTFNKHSWTSSANMIFLDQPVNVGFSYADGSTTVDNSPVAGKDVYAFLELFLLRFPEYSKQPVHISGESYAGTYVRASTPHASHSDLSQLPNVAKAIWVGNKQLEPPPRRRRPSLKKINLESIMIGNGITNPYIQMGSVADYACEGPYPLYSDPQGPECTGLRAKILTCQRMIKSCYSYNSRPTCVPAILYCDSQLFGTLARAPLKRGEICTTCASRATAKNSLCYEEFNWIDTWMNDPMVKVALGVEPSRKFASCSTKVSLAFLFQGDGAHNNAELLSELVNEGVRLLIYAGNADAMCDYIGNERWLEALDSSFQREFSKAKPIPWITAGSGKLFGTVRSAGGGGFTAGNVTFATVFEAGHMVPFDQPEAALDLFSRWISNTPLSLIGSAE
ncbi:Carboxypeptidase [Mycena sanguinolenta]|uniref:Carboxypeptidase n=1 Tax=Mycena sanguinolenta TaxID=230812 RepID=A0A8H6Z9A9_9AGAR|nr:Carboxypeptidase [Mycena sanguinolenta]